MKGALGALAVLLLAAAALWVGPPAGASPLLGLGAALLVGLVAAWSRATLRLPSAVVFTGLGAAVFAGVAALRVEGIGFASPGEGLLALEAAAVGLVALSVGSRVVLRELRAERRLLSGILAALFLLVAPALGLGVLFVAELAGTGGGFSPDALSPRALPGLLLLGTLFAAASASVAVSVVGDVRGEGRLSRLVQHATVLAQLVLLATVPAALALLTMPPGGSALEAFTGTVGTALLAGALLAVLLHVASRVAPGGAGVLLPVLVLGLAALFSPRGPALYLALLLGGLLAANLSSSAAAWLRRLERYAVVAFAVYFVTLGLRLEGLDLAALLPRAAIFVVARWLVIFVAVRLVLRWSGQAEGEERHLAFGLLAQDGVALVMVDAMAAQLGGLPAAMADTFRVAVILQLLAGPWLLARALRRDGEAREDRAVEVVPEALLPAGASLPRGPDLLPAAELDDPWLNARVRELRGLLTEAHRVHLEAPLERHRQVLRGELDRLREAAAAVVSASGAPGAAASERLTARRLWLEAVARTLAVLEAEPAPAPELASFRAFLEALREMEAPRSAYRVPLEARFFESAASDPAWLRTLKRYRRARRVFSGAGYRTVPLGRAWSYHVAHGLAHPVASAAEASAHAQETTWATCMAALRRIDAILASEEDRDGALALVTAQLDRMGEAFELAADQPRARLQEIVREAYLHFLEALRKAGTAELFDLSQRPGRRADVARAAEHRMDERLEAARSRLQGRLGWLRLDCERGRVEVWAREQLGRAAALRELLGGKGLQDLARAATKDEAEPPPRRLAQVADRVKRARESISDLALLLGRESAANPILGGLEVEAEGLSEVVPVLRVATALDQEASEEADLVRFPIREWFRTEVGRELALRSLEASQTVQSAVRRTLEVLEELEAAMAFALRREDEGAPAASGEDEARDGEGALALLLARAAERLERAHRELGAEIEDAVAWLEREMIEALEEATGPLVAQTPQVSLRRLSRQRRSQRFRGEGGRVAALFEPALVRYRRARAELAGGAGRLWRELAGPAQALPRRAAEPLEQVARVVSRVELPPAYVRLFAPAPLAIEEFYVPRPREEALLAGAARRFLEGEPVSVLLVGPRGSGRRSLLGHLSRHGFAAAGAPLADLPTHEVQLPPGFVTADAFAWAVASAMGLRRRRTASALIEATAREGRRRVVVVRDADPLFARTREGIASCAQAFELIRATREHVLWILVMASPPAHRLSLQLDLGRWFTDVVQVDPFGRAELEELVWRRHRVSGLEVTFSAPALGPVDRLRGLLEATPVAPDPRQRFFDALWSLSRGNPLAATQTWLSALARGPSGAWGVSPPAPPWEGHPTLEVTDRLLLAAVLEHGALSAEGAARLFGEEAFRVRLEHLTSRRLLELVPGQRELLRVPTALEPFLALELEKEGIL